MTDRRRFLQGAVVVGVGLGAGVLRPRPARAAPDVISCAAWGARQPAESPVVVATRPDKVLVHHTETANRTDYGTAQAFRVCRAIQAHHMDVNGWADTGQHFTVSREGYVLEGRRRSLETFGGGTTMVVGAHCPGQNDRAIGIENEGSYGAVAPPAALWDSLVSFTVQLSTRYGIAASSIYGHRDFYNTDCPGNTLYGRLPLLRAAVATGLGRSGVRSWPVLRPPAGGNAVRAAQRLLRATGATLTVDGSFGAATTAAVSAFQTARGLGADGVLGPVTWEALVAQLRQGSSGEAVRALQEQLVATGRTVSVTGTFGADTHRVTRSFQTASGIAADGIVGADTWSALVR